MLTILIVERNNVNFRLSVYPLNHIVRDFEIFAYFETILLTDNENNVHLYDLKTLFCYQTTQYSHIAKKSNTHLRILKTCKH